MGKQGSVSGSFTICATFGEMLKALRRRAHLTQRDLGVAVGYSETYITRLESDERRPDPSTVRTQFIEALHLEEEPDLARQLIKLAEVAREKAQNEPAVPPTIHVAPAQTNLPAQLTRFIGREQETAEVMQLLSEMRLLTLTGAGGVGKTRLAIEVGTRFALAANIPDSVWLVELAPLDDPALVAVTVAGILGLRLADRPAMEVLVDYLRDKHLLLILDNCEHLVGACAELAETLLQACPRLHVLATSRESLNLTGEVAYRVPSLTDNEAVSLFTDRAALTKPGFTVTAQEAVTIREICARLDGIPLAIELAVTRLRMLSIAQIATRLNDRFRLLTSGTRTAPPRQQTLRATIDWSYDLLTDAERALLRRLSVFAGGWTLEAAEALFISHDTFGLLAQLVSKSLVVVHGKETETRYGMLETIRQYAHEKLVEASEYMPARQAHLEYFTSLARSASEYWLKSGNRTGLDRLETEINNMREGLVWAERNSDTHSGAQLISGLFAFWDEKAYVIEGLKWIRAILPASSTLSNSTLSKSTRVMRGYWLGEFALKQSDFRLAKDLLAEASAMAHQTEDGNLILLVDLSLSFVTMDDEQALELLRLAQHVGQKRREAHAMWILGRRMRIKGDYEQAANWLTQNLAISRQLEDIDWISNAFGQLGLVALARCEVIQARALFEESVKIARQSEKTYTVAEYLTGVATAAVQQGDYPRAISAIRESIPIFHRMGNVYCTAQCLAISAHVALMLGQFERAAKLLGAATTMRRDFPPEFMEFEPELHEEYERCIPITRAAMGEAAFAVALAEGQIMAQDQAVGYALEASVVQISTY